MGLMTNENYAVFRWDEPDCKVLVSVAQRGNAANCHFACDRNGLRKMKQAIEEFCDFIFKVLEWCDSVMAIIEKKSVERLVKKCGFEHAANIDDLSVYVRLK